MLLPEEVQLSVKQYLEAMVHPVTVRFFKNVNEVSSDTMAELWQELGRLSDKLVIREDTGLPRGIAPGEMEGAVSELWRGDEFTGVRYLGITSGHEFSPLVETLLDLSTGAAPAISPQTLAWAQDLHEPLSLSVFVTPT